MSLILDSMEECVMMDKTTMPDGYGGTIPKWVDGAKFKAAVVFDTSMEARVGEHQGVTNLYTVTTNKNVNLQYHDVFRRLSDEKTFRVTSDGDDKVTPINATFGLRQVTAEEWKVANE